MIEDTDHLVISTSVKGYDLGDVKTGMTVEIKSDATGDSVIPGTLTTIAPTAKKNQLGDTEASMTRRLKPKSAWTARNPGFASAWRRG